MPNPRRTLLIVDDDQLLCRALTDGLTTERLEVFTASSAESALAECAARPLDVVLLDQKLPGADGASLCPAILRHNDATKVIFITAFPSFDNALTAIKAGAYDYLAKPFDLAEVALAVTRALRTGELERIEQLQHYRNDKESERVLLVGAFGGLTEIDRLIQLAADSEAPVLITGETGTGKNVIARAIHYRRDARHEAPFVSINCAALPESLIEAELFGAERGAFTGSVSVHRGLFELAEGGTLLLDEIGELPLHVQSKLLAVLEEHRVKRLGGEVFRPVNMRVMAATNADLTRALQEKTFRPDLYYRIGVLRIHVPPLRERRRDIQDLCTHFVRDMAGEHRVILPAEEVERLTAYDWPGNVRELRNVIERAIILRRGEVIRPSELMERHGGEVAHAAPLSSGETLPTLETLERTHIARAISALDGNYALVARTLDISLSTLKRKLKLYRLGRSAV